MKKCPTCNGTGKVSDLYNVASYTRELMDRLLQLDPLTGHMVVDLHGHPLNRVRSRIHNAAKKAGITVITRATQMQIHVWRTS